MVVLHRNGRTYGNNYLITFWAGLLLVRAHTHTHTHTRTRASKDLLYFGHCIWFDVLHGCKTYPLEAQFQSREQPEVTLSEIWRARWLADGRNGFLGEELLHTKWCISWFVIVQKPLVSTTCSAASSELHSATSTKIARRNDQQHTVEAVRVHGAPNCQCQRILETFRLPLPHIWLKHFNPFSSKSINIFEFGNLYVL
jgi:hypothetical protein